MCALEELPRVDTGKGSSEKTWVAKIIDYRMRDYYRREFGFYRNGSYAWMKKHTLSVDEIVSMLEVWTDNDIDVSVAVRGSSRYLLDRYLSAVSSNGAGHQVAQKDPNAWGLYDMHGNGWEWCSDVYGRYSTGAVTNPTGSAASVLSFVKRGGAWNNPARRCRSASRLFQTPNERRFSVGFRLLREP